MKQIQREDLHILSRHSNLEEEDIANALKRTVYNDRSSWQKFLRLFFISLGVGFTVSGIVFFFAYNWADLHKFAKIGLAEGLIIAATIVVLLPKVNLLTRNIILTGAAVLVGVLFVVFGQIYQTGANAYDFFLAWTVFVTLWMIVSNFAPLWLLYLVLLNTTFILYTEQVAKDWSEVFVLTLLFVMNTLVLVGATLFSNYRKAAIPGWFLYTVGLIAVCNATFGMIFGIFSHDEQMAFPLLFLLTLLAFTSGIWYGLKAKSGFYLSIIPFSTIMIISAWIIEKSHEEATYLFLSIFIIGSVTLVIKKLIDLQKKWTNEN